MVKESASSFTDGVGGAKEVSTHLRGGSKTLNLTSLYQPLIKSQFM